MKLYVRNITFKATQEELKSLFDEFGQVSECKLIKDHATGKSRGFAFVTMDDLDARDAIKNLNGFDFRGRELFVAEAKPQN